MGWFGRPTISIDPEVSQEVRDVVEVVMRDVGLYARSHGGAIELRRISADGEIRVKLKGSCAGCPLSSITLRLGIQKELERQLGRSFSVRVE